MSDYILEFVGIGAFIAFALGLTGLALSYAASLLSNN